ncbi:MAG: hypothetical protein K0R67_3682 [Paenibacillus sp.]|nr:hypothetical protein [Paenibacillus sp.]
MNSDWRQANQELQKVIVKSNGLNEPVSIESGSEQLSCIGIGTDAAVFRFAETPEYAFKIYTEQSLPKKDMEEEVYRQIEGSPFFPRFYGKGENYIVVSYEEGMNLYDCVLQGIPVPEQVISDVEEARAYVRSKGLNPRDIHLKNVLMQNGRGKVIDVSEYIQPGNDNRWEHLVWAYSHIYPLIAGKQISSWMLETIKHWYNRVDKASFALEEFAKQVERLFFGNRK